MKNSKNQNHRIRIGFTRMIALLLAIPLCILVSGCVGKAPVKVERTCTQYSSVPLAIRCKVKVTPIVDSVVIKNVSGNRGQCRAEPFQKLPFNGTFGNTVTVVFACPNNSEVLEVEVRTDRGDWDFSFE